MKKMVTSNEANKILKQLNAEKNRLTREELSSIRFESTEHDKAKDRPPYDFVSTQDRLWAIDKSVASIKHSINMFNTTTVLPNIGVTIDEALVKLAQLNGRRYDLDRMVNSVDKQRKTTYEGVTTYMFLNYNISEVREVLEATEDWITKIQLDLDRVNNSMEFEIEIDS